VQLLTQLLTGGVVGQFFLSALCRTGYGIYLFFAIMQLLAAIFVYYFLPEFSGIPIEKVSEVFRVHWFWKRYNRKDAESEALEREMQEVLAKRKKQQVSNRQSAEPIGGGAGFPRVPTREEGRLRPWLP